MSTDVPSGDWVVLELPVDDHAPKVAREFVRDHAQALPTEVIHDALLLVSELVTNAIRHGRPGIIVRVRTDPPGLGIAVEDHGERMPVLPTEAVAPDRVTGRGMLIVDAIAHSWGVIPLQGEPGKTVWFDLAATPVG